MTSPTSKRLSHETEAVFTLLIERIRRGDERALEKLLTAIAGPLRRMAARLIGRSLRPHIDAEDLVQGVSLILWRGFREDKFKVATSQHLIRLAGILTKRQAARAVKRLKAALTLQSTFEGDLSATLADRPLVPPDTVAEKMERDDQVRQLMMRVSVADRRMLELLLLGHTVAATARTLGVEPATLRMRLSRLRVRIRRGKRVSELRP